MFLVQKIVTKDIKKLGLPDPPPPCLGLSPKFYRLFLVLLLMVKEQFCFEGPLTGNESRR